MTTGASANVTKLTQDKQLASPVPQCTIQPQGALLTKVSVSVVKTHIELQGLRPLSDHAVAWPGDVAPLVLEQVVAPRSIAVTVECHRSASASCGGKAHGRSVHHHWKHVCTFEKMMKIDGRWRSDQTKAHVVGARRKEGQIHADHRVLMAACTLSRQTYPLLSHRIRQRWQSTAASNLARPQVYIQTETLTAASSLSLSAFLCSPASALLIRTALRKGCRDE